MLGCVGRKVEGGENKKKKEESRMRRFSYLMREMVVKMEERKEER